MYWILNQTKRNKTKYKKFDIFQNIPWESSLYFWISREYLFNKTYTSFTKKLNIISKNGSISTKYENNTKFEKLKRI